ncbi:MAG: glycoside hydrolase family 5 protein [Treponema sp.]|nr:glycoside hydrolase family 5 protein [Treponema sp.]
MKKIKLLNKLIISMLLVALTTCAGLENGTSDVVKEWKPWDGDKFQVRDDLTTQQLIEEMGLGINLGNTLEACGDWINNSSLLNYEKAWGSPEITKEMIEGYAKAGFSSLRIPVAWSNMMLPGYIINPDLLARVETIVNWTIDSGMVALVNLHWDGGWWSDFPKTYDECMKRFTAIWTQVSEHFKEYGDRLMLESMNEVGFDSVWTPWGGTQANKKKAFDIVNDMNKTFVDIVRASGGNNEKRHLLIEVYNTGLEYAYDPLFKMPDDPANRLAATVHYYTPSVFAILEEDADWGKARITWGTAADLRELNNNMELLKKNCVDKGIPVIVGEYAACGNNKTQEMKRLYAVSVTEAVYSRGMCPMLWDTPGDQYNRSTGRFRDPEFIKAFNVIPVKYPRR